MMGSRKLASAEAEIVEKQVLICKAFANPTRLRILDLLAERDRLASELQVELGIATANLSQHMTVLKAAGVVVRRRTGKNVLFSLVMPEIKATRQLIRNIVCQQIRCREKLAALVGV
jgi:DNA-binding transcriptional ArsR family regulator